MEDPILDEGVVPKFWICVMAEGRISAVDFSICRVDVLMTAQAYFGTSFQTNLKSFSFAVLCIESLASVLCTHNLINL